jgi:hypothetical protein
VSWPRYSIALEIGGHYFPHELIERCIDVTKKPGHSGPDQIYLSNEKLKKALTRFLLTKGEGGMGELVEELIFLSNSRGRVPTAVVSGDSDIFRQRVSEIIENWGIEIAEGPARVHDRSHLIRIPRFTNRESDRPLMAAYLFGENVDYYAENTQRGRVETVDLLLLWFLLAYKGWKHYEEMERFIAASVGKTTGSHIIFLDALNAGRQELPNLIGWLRDLIKTAPADLDISPHFHDLIRYGGREYLESKLLLWYLNWDEQASRKEDFHLDIPRIPISRVSQAMLNLQYLSKQDITDNLAPEVRSLFERVLQLRRELLGPSAKVIDVEKKIASSLGMEWKKYRDFTEKNHINLIFQKPDRVVKEFRQAKQLLFVSTPSETEAQPSGEAGVIQEEAKHGTGHGSSSIPGHDVKDQYVFQKEGATWRVSFEGMTKTIKDSYGMTYICRLLQKPKQEIHALSVENPGITKDRAKRLRSAGEVIDAQAIEEYKGRITEIDEELSVAKADDDQSRIPNLEQERSMLLSELQKAVGLHGKIREALSPGEFARQRVSKAIERAMKVIKVEHEPFWQHLKNSLNKGQFLSYQPDRSISWTT